MTTVIIILLCLIAYVYGGYFVLVILLGKLFKRPVAKLDIERSVVMMIAAYNEERNIEEKIINTLTLDYDKRRFRIVVVSDGSSDRTDAIVRSYAGAGVQLVHVPGRVGKTEARNIAIKQVREDIVIFSDATTVYRRDAIRKLIRNFADPQVGMVTGQLIYRDPSNSQIGFGQKLYWAYESLIKRAQTDLGTLTGSVGCMTAFRRRAYCPLPPNIIEDFTGPLMFIKQGFRIVYEREAVCYEYTTKKSANEWKMRVRVIRGGMTGLLHARAVLNPFKYPAACFQLISHKVLRWLVPVIALLLLVLSLIAVALDPSDVLVIGIMLGQVGFYTVALLAYTFERMGVHSRILGLPLYFTVLNLASLVALVKTLSTTLEPTWETQREGA